MAVVRLCSAPLLGVGAHKHQLLLFGCSSAQTIIPCQFDPESELLAAGCKPGAASALFSLRSALSCTLQRQLEKKIYLEKLCLRVVDASHQVDISRRRVQEDEGNLAGRGRALPCPWGHGIQARLHCYHALEGKDSSFLSSRDSPAALSLP